MTQTHHALGTPLFGPLPEGAEVAVFGLGCFWGAERLFWRLPGVYGTEVGYAGGPLNTANYREVCTGRTGHAEVVKVIYFPDTIPYERLLVAFWEGHDPTQGDRQGNDVGTQYRSAIYTTSDAQAEAARHSQEHYQARLNTAGYGRITTEVTPLSTYISAEDYHQQYLSKNPNGYCGLGGTGVRFGG